MTRGPYGSYATALLRKLILVPGATLPLRPLMRSRAVVFMLHRFRDPERGVEGQDLQELREGLAFLRRKRFQFIALDDLFKRLAEGAPVRRTIAFTIDDGYYDQATIGAKVFAEYDCPVTTFVTSGFLDGQLWFWWDKIEYVFEVTRRDKVQVKLGDQELDYSLDGQPSRGRALSDFVARCKAVPEQEKLAAISRLATQAGVEMPACPPPRYAPMTWEEARRCEAGGMSFGPHTVTHPILSKTTDQESRKEIADSWARLQSQVQRPVPVFCYPNGGPADFGDREVATLRQLGLKGAVVGLPPGYAGKETYRRSPDGAFRIPRFGFPENRVDLIQIVYGIERFKQILRREA